MSKLESVVSERIAQLFDFAFLNVKPHLERSRRYVALARRLSTRYKVSIPERFKKRFCKVCYRPWIAGYNVKVRLNQRLRAVEYLCDCGSLRRFGYKGKRKR